jgi:hypothetical protein
VSTGTSCVLVASGRTPAVCLQQTGPHMQQAALLLMKRGIAGPYMQRSCHQLRLAPLLASCVLRLLVRAVCLLCWRVAWQCIQVCAWGTAGFTGACALLDAQMRCVHAPCVVACHCSRRRSLTSTRLSAVQAACMVRRHAMQGRRQTLV